MDDKIRQFTSAFRAQRPARRPKTQRRVRATLSCTRCRVRKARCDRSQPCSECLKGGCAASCTFPSRNHGTEDQAPSPEMQDVRQISEPAPAESNEDTETPGPLASHAPSVGSDDAEYHGPTHWATGLEQVREVRLALESRPEPSTAPRKPDVLFGNAPALTIEHVRRILSSRRDVDKLVSLYFHSPFTTVPFIHATQFQARYAAFWKDPSSAGFLWISTLFSVLCIASIVAKAKNYAVILHMEVNEPSFYMDRAVESLVTGRYMSNENGAIEALLLHAHTRNICSRDSDATLPSIFGLVTRLAQCQGYHRDPKHLKRPISPYEAEMRRRTWLFAQNLDLMLSIQLGIPAIIHDGDCDTEIPGNYNDQDFDHDTRVMPPPRLPSDATQILYFQHKSALCHVVRKAMRHVVSTKPQAYHETYPLTNELDLWYSKLPACLRFVSIQATSLADHSHTIMYRIVLKLVYRRSLCMLHRHHLTTDQDDEQHQRSRDICRQSAMEMLELHAEFDLETKPGGRLHEDKYMTLHLGSHDFLVAAMVLCLDLNQAKHTSTVDRETKLSILQTACDIWKGHAAESKDAEHASIILSAMMRALSPKNEAHQVDPTMDKAASSHTNTLDSQFVSPNGLYERHELGSTNMELHEMMSFDVMFNNPQNLDWSDLDQYFRASLDY